MNHQFYTRKGNMTISETISNRRSIRAYLDAPVSTEDLEKIVEAGRWAPNAGPYAISVVRNPEIRQAINDRAHQAMLNSPVEFLRQRAALPGYQPLYSAPVLILLSGPANAPFVAINTAMAAENMILQATALGLGSCLLLSPNSALNGADNADLAGKAGIPEGNALQCAVIVGHAAPENKFTYATRAPKGTLAYVD